MTLKTKIYFSIFIILDFIGLLFFLGFIAIRFLEAADNASEPEVLLSATGLERHSLTLFASSPLVVEGQTLGEVLVYDDPTTKRPADYFELYDNPGDLIAVGWFDRFGIERMAVDRGILDGEDELEGVLVISFRGRLHMRLASGLR
jgi:hypothetical protein